MAIILGLLAFLVLVSATAGGVGPVTLMFGLLTLAVGVVALICGHIDLLRLHSRKAGVVVLAAGLVVTIVGGLMPQSVATQSTAFVPPRPGVPASSPALDTSSPRTGLPRATPNTSNSSSLPEKANTSPTSSSTKTNGPEPGTALAALAQAGVKGRAPKTGYAREAFGQTWADVDRNGCDSRNDILRRDLTDTTVKAGTRGCLVLTGVLADPYTGTPIVFKRGPSTSAAVQIDHVVALSNAWQTGAGGWTATKREKFANDPLNLLAVDGPTNEAKRDGDAATWLPPRRSYRCAYVARQITVKTKYGLWVTAAEKAAITRILRSCPTEPAARAAASVPLGGDHVIAAPRPTPRPTSRPSQSSRPSPGSAPGRAHLDPRYGTCKEANADGHGPYVQGKDPEYDWYRDRDKDGVVCESR